MFWNVFSYYLLSGIVITIVNAAYSLLLLIILSIDSWLPYTFSSIIIHNSIILLFLLVFCNNFINQTLIITSVKSFVVIIINSFIVVIKSFIAITTNSLIVIINTLMNLLPFHSLSNFSSIINTKAINYVLKTIVDWYYFIITIVIIVITTTVGIIGINSTSAARFIDYVKLIFSC